MENNNYPGSYYQPLFDLMRHEHGTILTESALTDIIEVVEKMRKAQPGQRWVKASERLPGWGQKVRWRLDGIERKVNDVLYMANGESPAYLPDYEWLDEQPGAISQDAHEKEIMMQAFDKVRQIFEGRQWVMEGRGSYPYNDDRYKEEVRYMYNEFDQVVKDTWANIQSKSVDYRKAIIAEYLATPAVGREEEAWIDVNYRLPYKDGDSSVYCLVNDTYDGIVVRPFNEAHVCWDQEDGDDYYTDAKGGKITHWRPLPEPPKRKPK